jgi:DUF4097 and DUF4098 domain-containing protein YvlB
MLNAYLFGQSSASRTPETCRCYPALKRRVIFVQSAPRTMKSIFETTPRYCTILILLLLSVSGLAHARNPAPDRNRGHQQVERTVAADPRVIVSACVASGNITVHGWDRNEVHARISDGVQIDLTRADQNKTQRATELKLTAQGRRSTRGSSCLPLGDVELTVPRGASVKLQTSNGEISVTEIAGVTATSQSGTITLEKVHGGVELSTIGGEISVRNSTGVFTLHTVGGSIDARDLGPARPGDSLEAGSVGGDVTLDRIRHQRLKLNTVGGDVTYAGPLSRGGRYSFQAFSGRLRLLLPANSSFRLKGTLGTGGEVSGDFNIAVAKPSNYNPMRSVDAIVGSGDASIDVSVFSGSIQIRKQ